jgi:CheY-like chemotaxis protein
MSEIEVDGADAEGARDAIAAKLAFLGVDPATVTASPLPVLVAEALGFVRASGAPPRVYFCGSIRGGRQLQPRYAAMIAWLQGRGYEVLTAHVGRADVLTFERATRVTDRAIYEGDMAWIEQADLVVADVTVPSLGVGMELMRADDLGKPILCLCEETTSLSSLVSGHPRAAVVRYRDDEDALRALSRAVEAHGSPASTRPAAEMRGEA